MLRHRFMIGGDISNVIQMVLLHSGEYRTQNTHTFNLPEKRICIKYVMNYLNGNSILESDLIQKNVPPGTFVMT